MNRLTRWYRRTIALDAVNRTMFYRILAAQIRGGITIQSACESLTSKRDLEEGVQALATAGSRAAAEGRFAADGFYDSGYLDSAHVGILRIAEQHGNLGEALAELARDEASVQTIPRNVLKPSIAQIATLAIAIGMLAVAPDAIDAITRNAPGVVEAPVYIIGSWVQTLGVWFGLVLVTLGIAIAVGRLRWTGSQRRLLLGFSKDWLDRLALQYCRLAASMMRHGATPAATMDAFATVNESTYVSTVLPIAQRELADGRAFADCLAQRLLAADTAAMLDGLVPGATRALYANAFDTLAVVIEAQLIKTYAVWGRWTKTAVMILTAAILVTLFHGMFAISQMVANQTMTL